MSQPPNDRAPGEDAGANRLRGRLMADSLGKLLGGVRGAREALPHLAALEAALAQKGAAALDTLPPAWRRRLGAQLASLPMPADDLPLRDLVQRLGAEAAASPSGAGAAPLAPPVPPSRAGSGDAPAPMSLQELLADPANDVGRTTEVREISHSEFMNIAEGTPRTKDLPPS